VWTDGTHVDFDRGLNFCIAQIRTALGDDAAAPQFVRTLPKRGYEFIAQVHTADDRAGADAPTVPLAIAAPALGALPVGRRSGFVLIAAGLLIAFIAGAIVLTRQEPGPIVAVAHFDNDTGDAALAPFADSLTDAVVERLATDGDGRYRIIGNAAGLRTARDQRDLVAIGLALHAQYVVLGQIQRDAGRTRVLAHLIRLPDQTHVAVSRTEDVQAAAASLDVIDALSARIAKTIDAKLRDPGARTAAAPGH
jgi:TolB-like protein